MFSNLILKFYIAKSSGVGGDDEGKEGGIAIFIGEDASGGGKAHAIAQSTE